MATFDDVIEQVLHHVDLAGVEGLPGGQFERIVRSSQQQQITDAPPQDITAPPDSLLSDAPPSRTAEVDDNFVVSVLECLCKNPAITVLEVGEHHNNATSTPCADTSISASTSTLPTLDGKRICASEERRWKAVTGHDINHKLVPPLEFSLLSVIAAHGASGVLQPDARRLTGQDKRSVPRRTDMLVDKGYITKQTVIGGGCKTSLLKLAKYPNEPTQDDETTTSNAPEPKGDKPIVYYHTWFDTTINVLRNHDNIVTMKDLRMHLDIQHAGQAKKQLARCVRRLEDCGCVRRITALLQDKDGNPQVTALLVQKKAKAIQLVREPTEHDRAKWMADDPKTKKVSLELLDDEDNPKECTDDDDSEDGALSGEEGELIEDSTETDVNRLIDTSSGLTFSQAPRAANGPAVDGPNQEETETLQNKSFDESMTLSDDHHQPSMPDVELDEWGFPRIDPADLVLGDGRASLAQGVEGIDVDALDNTDDATTKRSSKRSAADAGLLARSPGGHGHKRTRVDNNVSSTPTRGSASTFSAGASKRKRLTTPRKVADSVDHGSLSTPVFPGQDVTTPTSRTKPAREKPAVPQNVKKREISAEELEAYEAEAQKAAERMVLAEMRSGRRRLASEASIDESQNVPEANFGPIDVPRERVEQVKADIIARKKPGIYINPPGAKNLKMESFVQRGRPRTALIAVIKTEGLKALPWFQDQGGPRFAPKIGRRQRKIIKFSNLQDITMGSESAPMRECEGLPHKRVCIEVPGAIDRSSTALLPRTSASEPELHSSEGLPFAARDEAPLSGDVSGNPPSDLEPNGACEPAAPVTLERELGDMRQVTSSSSQLPMTGLGANPTQASPVVSGSILGHLIPSAMSNAEAQLRALRSRPGVKSQKTKDKILELQKQIEAEIAQRNPAPSAVPINLLEQAAKSSTRQGNSIPILDPSLQSTAPVQLPPGTSRTRRTPADVAPQSVDGLVQLVRNTTPDTEFVQNAQRAAHGLSGETVTSPKKPAPKRKMPSSPTVTTQYVDDHPDETFWHRGKGRWSRGLPPSDAMPKTGVRGRGAEVWKAKHTVTGKVLPRIASEPGTPRGITKPSPQRSISRSLQISPEPLEDQIGEDRMTGNQLDALVTESNGTANVSLKLANKMPSLTTSPKQQAAQERTIKLATPTSELDPVLPQLNIIRPYGTFPSGVNIPTPLSSGVSSRLAEPAEGPWQPQKAKAAAVQSHELPEIDESSIDEGHPAPRATATGISTSQDKVSVPLVAVNTKTPRREEPDSTVQSGLVQPPAWNTEGASSDFNDHSSTMLQIQQSILLMMRLSNGVIPGDLEVLRRFVISAPTPADESRSTQPLERALLDLLNRQQLRRLTFQFQSKSGIAVRRSMLTEPGIDSKSSHVRNLQKKIIAAYPGLYFPLDTGAVPGLNGKARDGQTIQAKNLVETHGAGRSHFPYTPISVRQTQIVPSAEDLRRRSLANKTPAPRAVASHTPQSMELESDTDDTDDGTISPEQAAMQSKIQLSNYIHDLSAAQKPKPTNRSHRHARQLRFDDGRPKKMSPALSQKNKKSTASKASTKTPPTSDQQSSLLRPSQPFHAPTGTFGTISIPAQAGTRSNEDASSPSSPIPAISKARAETPPIRDHQSSLLRPSQHFHAPTGTFGSVLSPRRPQTGSKKDTLSPPSMVLKLKVPNLGSMNAPTVSVQSQSKLASVQSPVQSEPVSATGRPKRRYKSRAKPAIVAEEDLRDSDSEFIPLPASRKANGTSNDQITARDRKAPATFQDTDRLISAYALVSAVCGGINQDRLSWPLIAHCMSFRYDAEFLRRRWPHTLKMRRRDIEDLRYAIREPFLRAYEGGELPRVDFQRLNETDWPALLEWVETTIRPTVIKGGNESATVPDLPNTRQSFDASFVASDETPVWGFERDEFFSTTTDMHRRHLILRYDFGNAISDHGSGNGSGITNFVLASWVRAVAVTKQRNWNGAAAAQKLSIFNEAQLSRITTDLLESRLISQERRGRQLPGRNYYLHSDVLAQFRRWPAKPEEQMYLRFVAQAYSRIAEHFELHDSLLLNPAASDPEYMVLTNMVAHGLLRVTVQLPARNDDPQATGQRLAKWGYAGAGYETKKVDISELKFPIVYAKTPTYVGNHNLITGIPLPMEPNVRPGEEGSRLPFWVDIHGNLIEDVWDMVVRSIIHLLVFRPGSSAATMEKAHKNKLWVWEIELVLKWLEKVGVARRIGKGAEEDGVWKGGWISSEFWFCAFSEELVTWDTPRGDEGQAALTTA